ncbi:FIST N-terminal domain-containing protein [Caenispirillum bisanense]|uniref:Small ligand-binding sensory domain FIST n=1 Tax=Caenispirillum bisanense TaxID=414052 RepID=A0A286GTY7_9PROT|nr:FIST C-terminal domain-containing protein [Caenispirillum bisanense]SOD99005.1 Small ligand-binding sensory domain FIST [Caenispirillum bisanense]
MTAERFLHALGRGSDWRACVAACLSRLRAEPGEALGFVYVTRALARDLGAVLTALREGTGVEHWVGAVGSGVIATGWEEHEAPAVSVMIAPLPAEDWRLLATLMRNGDGPDEDVMDWVGPVAPVLGLVHGDPDNGALPFVIHDLVDQTEGFLVGGVTAAVADASVPLQVAGLPTRGGLSGVLFSGHLPALVGVTQGCRPIGGWHTVTGTARMAVAGLDDRLPLDVLREETGARSRAELEALAGVVGVGVPLAGSDRGDFEVLPLVAIDPKNGWIATGCGLEPGQRLRFVRRDAGTVEDDMRAMLRRLKARLGNRTPRGGVYVGCLARGPRVFGGTAREARLIAEELGEFPLTGFFGSGEISHNRLYSHAGVLTLFL